MNNMIFPMILTIIVFLADGYFSTHFGTQRFQIVLFIMLVKIYQSDCEKYLEKNK